MNEGRLTALFLTPAKEYIAKLSENTRASIAASVELMKIGVFDAVDTKQLRGHIRELIVGPHRLTYFRVDKALYFIGGFRKRGQKTPLSEILYAEKIYKIVRQKSKK